MRLLGQTQEPQQPQQPVQSTNQSLKQQFLQRPNPAGSLNLNGQSPQPQQQNGSPVSLADALRRNLQAAGITDQMLADDTR
jgi:hypothetical protein